MTTPQIKTELATAERNYKAARRAEDWLEAQHAAARIASLCHDLRMNQVVDQRLNDVATPLSVSAWLRRTRKAIGV